MTDKRTLKESSPSSYLKKLCLECDLLIETPDDEEKIRAHSGRSEYYHKACINEAQRKIKAEKKRKAKGGRPPAITPERKTKLDEAFSANCNKTEACLHAGIATKTLERYIEKNPKYSLRIEELRSNPRLVSKMNVSKQLKAGDINASQFVLTHTDEEYKPKKEIEHTGGLTLLEQIIADDEGEGSE